MDRYACAYYTFFTTSLKIMMNNTNTPTPWRIDEDWEEDQLLIAGDDKVGNYHTVAIMGEDDHDNVIKANAELIVKAVNNYEPMLKALEYVQWWIDVNNEGNNVNFDFGILKSAIQSAKGELT